MGAKVAQTVAFHLRKKRTGPALVAVVLISPAPSKSLRVPQSLAIETHKVGQDRLTARRALTDTYTVSWRRRPFQRAFPDFAVDDMLRGHCCALTAWSDYAMAEDTTSKSLSIRCTQEHGCVVIPDPPVLVLASEKDLAWSQNLIRKLVTAEIPGAEMEVLPNCGHLSPLDAPEQVAKRIISFANDAKARQPYILLKRWRAD